jgi:nitric oxide dioxygenase
MNEQQVALVQTTWEQVVPIADTAAGLFYDRLFEVAPAVRPMFADDLTEQKQKLMQMITTVVRSLDRLDRVVPAIQALGRRHAEYGAEPAHYDVVGATLLWTLEQGLGEAWTDEAARAWAAAYGVLADTMLAAAATPPAQAA